jgi:hypothetical protein
VLDAAAHQIAQPLALLDGILTNVSSTAANRKARWSAARARL